MTQEELDKIIEQHQHWLLEDVECASGFHFFRTREEAEKY